MLEKARKAVGGFKDNMHQRKLEKAYERKQRELEEERQEAQRVEREQENLKEEYERLSSLDEKQQMAELIFAVRGFYSEIEVLRDHAQDLEDKIDGLEEEISELRMEIRSSESGDE